MVWCVSTSLLDLLEAPPECLLGASHGTLLGMELTSLCPQSSQPFQLSHDNATQEAWSTSSGTNRKSRDFLYPLESGKASETKSRLIGTQ